MANKLDANEHQINWAELGLLSELEINSLLHPQLTYDYDAILSDIKAQVDGLFP